MNPVTKLLLSTVAAASLPAIPSYGLIKFYFTLVKILSIYILDMFT